VTGVDLAKPDTERTMVLIVTAEDTRAADRVSSDSHGVKVLHAFEAKHISVAHLAELVQILVQS